MTAKERLERIKTVIKNSGVYRDYTDSTQAFNEDVEVVEQALTEYEELKNDVKRFMELYNPPQPYDEYDILRVKLSKVGKEE